MLLEFTMEDRGWRIGDGGAEGEGQGGEIAQHFEIFGIFGQKHFEIFGKRVQGR